MSVSSPTGSSHTTSNNDITANLDEKVDQELIPILRLLEAQQKRLYQEGYFMMLRDLDQDGKPCHQREWKEVYAQLIGTVLSVWDADELNNNNNAAAKKPSYINISDASFRMMPTLSTPSGAVSNLIALSTTLRNRYLLQFASSSVLQLWFSSFKLAIFEWISLQEAYTGGLLSSKGKTINGIHNLLSETKFKHGEWTRVRFGAGMPWKKCFAVIYPAKPSKKNKKKKQVGSIEFYQDDKKKSKKQPLATIVSAYSTYAVFPQSAALLNLSTLYKIEGKVKFPSDDSHHHHEPRDAIVFVMPDTHPAVSGYETLIRSLIPAFDTFGLYGRPERLNADRKDLQSLLFGLPIYPKSTYLNVDDVALLALKPDSGNWSDEEWRSSIKELLSRKMASTTNNDDDSTRRASYPDTKSHYHIKKLPIRSPYLSADSPTFEDYDDNSTSDIRPHSSPTPAPIVPPQESVSRHLQQQQHTPPPPQPPSKQQPESSSPKSTSPFNNAINLVKNSRVAPKPPPHQQQQQQQKLSHRLSLDFLTRRRSLSVGTGPNQGLVPLTTTKEIDRNQVLASAGISMRPSGESSRDDFEPPSSSEWHNVLAERNALGLVSSHDGGENGSTKSLNNSNNKSLQDESSSSRYPSNSSSVHDVSQQQQQQQQQRRPLPKEPIYNDEYKSSSSLPREPKPSSESRGYLAPTESNHSLRGYIAPTESNHSLRGYASAESRGYPESNKGYAAPPPPTDSNHRGYAPPTDRGYAPPPPDLNNRGYPPPAGSNRGYPSLDPNRGYPDRGYGGGGGGYAPSGYPPAGSNMGYGGAPPPHHPTQGSNNRGYPPPQGYPAAHPNRGYPNRGYGPPNAYAQPPPPPPPKDMYTRGGYPPPQGQYKSMIIDEFQQPQYRQR